MEKISVIMPAYNSESSIQKSIQSILNQTYANLELIIVNDGSTDNTEEVVRKIADSDKRIHYVYKKNEGVSKARNTALDYASGDYVAFIDSDDYYQADMLEILLSYAEDYQCDLVSASFERVYGDDTSPEETFFAAGYYDKDRLVSDIYPSLITDKSLLDKVPRNIVTKLYRKSIIDEHHIRFDERLRYGEDLLFSEEYFLYANSFYYLPDAYLYKYVMNENSVTHSLISDRDKYLAVALNSRNRLCEQFPQYTLTAQLPYLRVKTGVSQIANMMRYKGNSRKEIVNDINSVIKNPQITEACGLVDPREFNFSRRLVFQFLKIRETNLIYLLIKLYGIVQN